LLAISTRTSCHDRFKNLFPDPDVFAVFLEDHPRLKTAMHYTDVYFSSMGKKRWEQAQAENKLQYEAGETERRSSWERNEAQKCERVFKTGWLLSH
jgi:hypothetical protein